jgi:hypothetical protein
MKIPLPPIDEQHKIVNNIEKLEKEINETKALKAQIMSDLKNLKIGTYKFVNTPTHKVGYVAYITKLAGFEYTKYFTNAMPGPIKVIRAGNVRNDGLDLTNAMTSAFSGSYFPVKVMPKGFLFISLILPLTYIYDSSRTILVNQTPLLALKTEFIIIIASMIVFWLLGSWIFMRVERKCRELGILGTH